MMDSHPRRFRLVVQEITCNVMSEHTATGLGVLDGEDYVEIVYAGKVYPSTRKRIGQALSDGSFEQAEKRLC